ncbi:MAG: phosphoribosylamine--glycine ligase [bacterium]
MKILLLGSGGREHALAWKILKSSHTKQLWVAPGNAGIAQEAECVSLDPSQPAAVVDFAKKNKVDLVVVGPEAPLVAGVSDALNREKIAVFGPSAAGAELEASKAYTKALLKKNRIPTAGFECFSDSTQAKAYLKDRKYPQVVKADGLAAGKGVIIAQNEKEAVVAVEEILEKKSLGVHQSQIVIEDFLAGEEASFMVVSDGKNFLPLATSQDHKRLNDGDEGPNTGGMGAYSPAPVVTPKTHDNAVKQIIEPTFAGLRSVGIDYRGILYAGLMIENEVPSLLEYNVRFGDPECQAILPRMKSDLVELMMAVVEGSLSPEKLQWYERSCVCIVLAAEGYPNSPRKGDVIEGIEDAAKLKDVTVFHAGTAKKDGQWVTNGGRVLGVTALGDTLQLAIDQAYAAVKKIHWKGMHYRKDIGKKGLAGYMP